MGGIAIKPEKKKELDLEKGENKDPEPYEEMIVWKKIQNQPKGELFHTHIDLELGIKKFKMSLSDYELRKYSTMY
jgi:hypothetical protein